MKHIIYSNLAFHYNEEVNRYVSDNGTELTAECIVEALANGDLREAQKVPAVRYADGSLFVWDNRNAYQVIRGVQSDTILSHASLLNMLVEGAELTEVWL